LLRLALIRLLLVLVGLALGAPGHAEQTAQVLVFFLFRSRWRLWGKRHYDPLHTSGGIGGGQGPGGAGPIDRGLGIVGEGFQLVVTGQCQQFLVLAVAVLVVLVPTIRGPAGVAGGGRCCFFYYRSAVSRGWWWQVVVFNTALVELAEMVAAELVAVPNATNGTANTGGGGGGGAWKWHKRW
jgi:hypothetical protein